MTMALKVQLVQFAKCEQWARVKNLQNHSIEGQLWEPIAECEEISIQEYKPQGTGRESLD